MAELRRRLEEMEEQVELAEAERDREQRAVELLAAEKERLVRQVGHISGRGQ